MDPARCLNILFIEYLMAQATVRRNYSINSQFDRWVQNISLSFSSMFIPQLSSRPENFSLVRHGDGYGCRSQARVGSSKIGSASNGDPLLLNAGGNSAYRRHSLAFRVQERVPSEITLNGFRPRPRFGTTTSLLSQDREDSVVGLPNRAWSEQAKVSDSMSIALWNVLTPTFNKLFRRALYVDFTLGLLVFVPKADGSLSDVSINARWQVADAAQGTTKLYQEMLTWSELYAPPAFLLLVKNRF